MKFNRLLTLFTSVSLFSAFAFAEPLKVDDNAPVVCATRMPSGVMPTISVGMPNWCVSFSFSRSIR